MVVPPARMTRKVQDAIAPRLVERRSRTIHALLILFALLGGIVGYGGLATSDPKWQKPATLGSASVVTDPAGSKAFDLDHARVPTELTVQLLVRRVAFLPRLAVHPSFWVFEPERGGWEKFEVWGSRYGSPSPYREHRFATTKFFSDRPSEPMTKTNRRLGYVWHEENVESAWELDESVVLGQWCGRSARRIVDVLRRSDEYP